MERGATPLAAAGCILVGLALVALASAARRTETPEEGASGETGRATAPREAAPATAERVASPDGGLGRPGTHPATSTQPARESPAARALRRGERIDVNAASEEDLRLLPGIGPTLARRIVASRRAHGTFDEVDDLARVSGIGPKTIARLRHLLLGARGRPAQAADLGAGHAPDPPRGAGQKGRPDHEGRAR